MEVSAAEDTDASRLQVRGASGGAEKLLMAMNRNFKSTQVYTIIIMSPAFLKRSRMKRQAPTYTSTPASLH